MLRLHSSKIAWATVFALNFECVFIRRIVRSALRTRNVLNTSKRTNYASNRINSNEIGENESGSRRLKCLNPAPAPERFRQRFRIQSPHASWLPVLQPCPTYICCFRIPIINFCASVIPCRSPELHWSSKHRQVHLLRVYCATHHQSSLSGVRKLCILQSDVIAMPRVLGTMVLQFTRSERLQLRKASLHCLSCSWIWYVAVPISVACRGKGANGARAPWYARQGRPLADWTDCFQSGPALRLPT